MVDLQELNPFVGDEDSVGAEHKERRDRVDGVRLSAS